MSWQVVCFVFCPRTGLVFFVRAVKYLAAYIDDYLQLNMLWYLDIDNMLAKCYSDENRYLNFRDKLTSSAGLVQALFLEEKEVTFIWSQMHEYVRPPTSSPDYISTSTSGNSMSLAHLDFDYKANRIRQ